MLRRAGIKGGVCEGQRRESAWGYRRLCVLACPQVLRNDRQGEGRRVKVRIKDLEIKKEKQRMRQKETKKREIHRNKETQAEDREESKNSEK